MNLNKKIKISVCICILFTSFSLQLNGALAITLPKNNFLKKPLTNAIPLGIIALWPGTLESIPNGWVICNGSNGTPDLRNKFILSVDNGEDPGAVGGSDKHYHTYSYLPQHTHGIDDLGHTHSFSHHQMYSMGCNIGPGIIVGVYNFPIIETGLITPEISLNNEGITSCQTNNTSHLPPFCEIVFIMNVSPSNDLPLGIIIMVEGSWEELLYLQTKGWTFCNGWNGTPDLCQTALDNDNRFIRMTNETYSGSVGGSFSHEHSYSDLPQHNHSLTNPGHTHDYEKELEILTANDEDNSYLNVYSSFQTNLIETGLGVNHTGSQVCKTHLNSNLPPYYELAFLMKTEIDAILPSETIMFWRYSLEGIPLEWSFCNGTNGTPDLTNKFIRSCDYGQSTGIQGGNSSHNHGYTEIPLHNHSKNETPHSHSYTRTNSYSGNTIRDVTGGSYNFLVSALEYKSTSREKTGITVDYEGINNCKSDLSSHLPPYYKLAFIQYQPTPGELNLESDAADPDYDGRFQISWNAPLYTDFYNIYEYPEYIYEVNESIRIDSVYNNDSYAITKTSSGIYYYRVVALNQYGNSTSLCIKVTIDLDTSDDNYIIFILTIVTISCSAFAITLILILRFRKKRK